MSFAEEVDLEHMQGLEGLDKHECREIRAKTVWNIVNQEYQSLL